MFFESLNKLTQNCLILVCLAPVRKGISIGLYIPLIGNIIALNPKLYDFIRGYQ